MGRVRGIQIWKKQHLMEEKHSQLTIYITEGGKVEFLTAEDKSS